MEQNNSNIPVVKVGDTIYELYGSYGKLCLRKVVRITKTQIILDNNKKLRNDPLRMYGDEEAYCLDSIGRSRWRNANNYYIETEKLIAQYKQEQLILKIKKAYELLKLEKLTNEQLNQLNILLSAMTPMIIMKENQWN